MEETLPDDDASEDDGSGGIGARVRSKLPSKPSMATPKSATSGAAEEFSGAIASILVTILISVTKLLPFTERFWRGMINAGYRGLHKKLGTDHLGHILVGNEIKIVGLDYDYDKQRFENEFGDWWKAPTEADYEYRIAGKVPAIWATASSNHVGSHLQAEVAEVLDVGDSRPLYESADIQVQVDATQLEPSGQGQAMADGGGFNMQITGERPGAFKDEIVDLSHEANGRVVSMEKYYQTYPAVVDPEEMQMQEWRGRKAEESRDYGKFAMKMLLIAGGIIAAVTLGPPMIQALFGGGGGGGGAGSTVLPGMLAGFGGVI